MIKRIVQVFLPTVFYCFFLNKQVDTLRIVQLTYMYHSSSRTYVSHIMRGMCKVHEKKKSAIF